MSVLARDIGLPVPKYSFYVKGEENGVWGIWGGKIIGISSPHKIGQAPLAIGLNNVNIQFCLKNIFFRHLQAPHDWECRKCDRKFTTRALLSKHMHVCPNKKMKLPGNRPEVYNTCTSVPTKRINYKVIDQESKLLNKHVHVCPNTGQSFPIPRHSQTRAKNADLVTLEI